MSESIINYRCQVKIKQLVIAKYFSLLELTFLLGPYLVILSLRLETPNKSIKENYRLETDSLVYLQMFNTKYSSSSYVLESTRLLVMSLEEDLPFIA